MAVRVLIVGGDIHIHKLVVDILEITFKETVIDRAINEEGLFGKLDSAESEYNLVIIDCPDNKKAVEDLFMTLTNSYPHVMSRLIILIDSQGVKPADDILQNISCVVKPFSLDEFGELVKKTVKNNN